MRQIYPREETFDKYLSSHLTDFPIKQKNKKTPKKPTLCSQKTISRLIEYQPKSNEKYMPFLHCISGFKGLLQSWSKIDRGFVTF